MDPELTAEQELQQAIDEVLAKAQAIGESKLSRSRENSLVVTKLEEAQLWNTKDIQHKENG